MKSSDCIVYLPSGISCLVSCVQLKNIADMTLDVKGQVMYTLENAQKKKNLFETSNKKLKDFIQKIRDFLMGIFISCNICFVLS